MKCEKCGEREANFFYTATINSETTQRHLCSECAQAEGFDRVFQNEWSTVENMLGGGMMPCMSSPFSGFFSEFMPMMTIPARLVFGVPTQTEPQPEASEQKIPEDAGEAFRARRELVMLKSELQEAVKVENFEKAIELRDKIKQFEA